jgi:hypothetical protein
MSSPESSVDATFRIASIGPLAARTLARTDSGVVGAVFERSAYLDFGSEFVCVGAPAIGNGPLNAVVDSAYALSALRIGARVDVLGDGRNVRVGDVAFEWSQARRWHPLPFPSRIVAADLARGVANAYVIAKAQAPADGLACLVTGTHGSPSLAAMARPAADAFRTWLAVRRTVPVVPPALAALIGLGPGLTPSGDDFLGGALVALHAFGEPPAAGCLAAWLRPRLDRTHPISAAHLAAACEGIGGEALHACIHAIAAGDHPRAPIERVAAIGHTSGWDALAGVLVVADVLAQASASEPAHAG